MKFTEYFSPQLVKKNFLAMSWLLKVFFALNIYSFVADVLALVQQKEVTLSYFGTGFPQNFPAVWYIYNILFAVFTVYVLMKRSKSLLVKYTAVSAGVILLAFASEVSSIDDILNQPSALPPAFYYSMYAVLFVFIVLLLIYPLTQKKYFNQK